MNIYREWTIEHKGTTYLSKKYGIRSASIKYLVSLIHRHGIGILDKPYTYYSAQFKLEAINLVLVNHEAAYSVSLELGLKNQGTLTNWIRSYKENGYNVVIKKKDDEPVNKDLEKLKKENEKLRRQNLKLTVENAFIKKLDALVQKRKKQPKQK